MTRTQLKKGWKPFLIKYMALFMGVCYLANPLHQQIGTVFHEISHILESPDTVISHQSVSNDISTHGYHEHLHKASNHDHTLFDLLASIFSASDDKSPSDGTTTVQIKLDKHLASFEYSLRKPVPTAEYHDFYNLEPKILLGHSYILGEPPQNS